MADETRPARGRRAPRDRFAVDLSLLILRLGGGIIFLAHGSQKVLGAFDGPGLKGVMSDQGPGGGGTIGLLVAIGEFFGAIGLLLGILSRFSAAAIIAIMLGAIALVHGRNGFFLNPQAPGLEYNLALIALLLPMLIAGPGRFSLARMLPLPGRPISPLE
jgi:putative oxidoreductase